jgi:alpha-amylase
MATICISLYLHQPFILRRYSVFEQDAQYFDMFRSRDACRRLAVRSIYPTNRVLLSLLRHFQGRFRLSLALSGTAIDLLERFAPDALDSFRALVDTGHVEMLAGPYDNALALLYSPSALAEQLTMQRDRVADVFGQIPQVVRHGALMFNDELADQVAALGFSGVLCEGAGDALAGRGCSRVYSGGSAQVPLLLRNERLSRDLAERFDDRGWDQWPLTAPRYAEWLARFDTDDEVVALDWGYPTFGVRVPADAGIFDFLRYLPEKVLAHPTLGFATAGEALARHAPVGAYAADRLVCAAEHTDQLSTWLGNPMQSHAIHQLYALEPAARAAGDPSVLTAWRRLQAMEYLEAMAMHPSAMSAGGHDHLSGMAVDSPYDAYINYMNICDSLGRRCGVAVGV